MRLLLLCLCACALAAQTPDSQVVFEVATVKHGPPRDYSASSRGGPGTADPTTYTIENYPMSSLLEIAYGLSSYRIFGPAWLAEERFTIAAKLPAGTTKEQLMLMMRTLLVERFKIAAHIERKEIAGYDLIVAKGGLKMAASPGPPNEDDAPVSWPTKPDKEGYPNLPPGRQAFMTAAGGRIRWRFVDESMDTLASKLADNVGRPIVDATGLTGKYDFEIYWSADAMSADPPADSGSSLFTAVQQQLGLKLEPKKVPGDTVVIDRIERTPREN